MQWRVACILLEIGHCFRKGVAKLSSPTLYWNVGALLPDGGVKVAGMCRRLNELCSSASRSCGLPGYLQSGDTEMQLTAEESSC